MAGNAIIMDLEKKNVILAKKIVLEAEKVRKLEVKIEDMTAKVREEHGRAIRERRDESPADYMARLGSGSAVADMQKKEQREIKVLEQAKQRQTRMLDDVENSNQNLKDGIDAFRKNAMSQHALFDSLSRELERVKLELLKALEIANNIDNENKQIAETMKSMQADHEREREDLVSSHPHLFEMSRQSVGGRRKGELSEVDVGTAGLSPGQRMQRRMRELDHEAAKLLSEADGQRKEIEKYETHFEALRRCTKLNSVTDMLKRFADREDAKLSKMKLIQELNDQTAAVEQERRAVVAAQEEYCKVMGSADEKQRARIAELQRERDRAREEKASLDDAINHANNDINQVAAVLHRLFFALELEKTGVDAIMNGYVPNFGKPEVEEAAARLSGIEKRGKALGVDKGSSKRVPSPPRSLAVLKPSIAGKTAGPTFSRGLAEAEMESLLKTGVNKDNIHSFIALIEHRVVTLIPEFTKAFEGRGGVQTLELQPHHKVIVTAPTAVDANANLSEDSLQHSLLTTLETELKELSRAPPRSPVSPAWRKNMTSSPLSHSQSFSGFPKIDSAAPLVPSGKKKESGVRFASRSELQDDVLREFEGSDMSKFIKTLAVSASAAVNSDDESDGEGGYSRASSAQRGSKGKRGTSAGSGKRPNSQPQTQSVRHK